MKRAMIESAWMDFAICTPDPAWTADHLPDRETLSRLGAICAVCPVIAECAAYAVANRCETGMYAGVWVPTAGAGNAWPSRNGNRSWLEARRALIRKSKALVTR